MQFRHKSDESTIIYSDDTVIIDVRKTPPGYGPCKYEICVGRAGSSVSFVAGHHDDWEKCKEVAKKLARYPLKSLSFVGL